MDSEILWSLNLDSVLIQPNITSCKIVSCLGQVSMELGHKDQKLRNIHGNRLKRHNYIIFCDSVSRQWCDMVKQIFFKNLIGRGNISWLDTQWYPMTPLFGHLLAHFLKAAFQSISVEQGQMDTIFPKLQYWNSCEWY